MDFTDIEEQEVRETLALPDYVREEDIEVVKRLFENTTLGVKAYEFIKSVKDIEEQASMAHNTFCGQKQISRRERPNRYSSKLLIQALEAF